MNLTQNPRKSRRSCGAMCALALLVMLGSACGNDDDQAEDGGAESATSETSAASTTSQPVAAAAGEVRPLIEDLLGAWDESMTAILADPRLVVDDPNHRLRTELAASFTSDSPYVRDLDLLLRTAYIDQDAGVRPGPAGLVQQTSLLQFTETPDDDHLGFVFCTYDDGVGYTLSSGADRPPGVSVTQGAGEATRVDGVWLLHRLRQLGHETKPAGSPNPCPDLVEAEGGG